MEIGEAVLLRTSVGDFPQLEIPRQLGREYTYWGVLGLPSRINLQQLFF